MQRKANGPVHVVEVQREVTDRWQRGRPVLYTTDLGLGSQVLHTALLHSFASPGSRSTSPLPSLTLNIYYIYMSLIPPTIQEIINAALVKYTKLTEKDLRVDPLATKIQLCDSPTAICDVLQQHAKAFHDYTRLRACLNVIVDKLHTLSTTPALSELASLQVVSLKDCILYHCPI